jgi:O-antigen/teichoic acid export membrane protein
MLGIATIRAVIPILTNSNEVGSEIPQASKAESADAVQAESLVRRAPMGILWNQLYQVWFFGASLLLTEVVTHGLSPDAYGVYSYALTAFTTISYLAAFGLEEAATIWVPRALTEEGRSQASSVIRRLIAVRLLFILATCAAMVFLFPLLPGWLAQLSVPGAAGLASALAKPALQDHLGSLAFYIGGSSFVNLLFATFVSMLRTRVIFIISGCSQVANLALAGVFLKLGWGVDGTIWALGIVSWVTAVAYLIWLSPLLFARRPSHAISLLPALRLSVAAWLTNLAGGALFKQAVVFLLGTYAIASAQIGFFNLAFQLGHSAGLLLVAGLSSVGMATMTAAYTGQNRAWLSVSWRAVLKVQILLAVPLLLFSLLNAQALVDVLFPKGYGGVGPLLQLFLAFNILTRVSGGGIHQAALYVLGKSGYVVLVQWASLGLTIVLGILLIPQTGPLGALIATGVPPVLVEWAQLARLLPSLTRPYPLRFVLRYAAALVAPILVGVLAHPADWLKSLVSGSLLNWLSLMVSGLLFVALLVGGLLVMKPLEAEDAAMLGQTNSWLRAILKLLVRKSALAAPVDAAPVDTAL